MKSKNKRPLVLTAIESVEYQDLLELVDVDFLFIEIPASVKLAKVYSNGRLIKDLTPNIKPDLFLCQNKLTQYTALHQYAAEYNKPLICVNHNAGSDEKIRASYGLRFSKEIFYSEDHSQSWESDNPTIIKPTYNSNHVITSNIYINISKSFTSILNTITAMRAGKCVLTLPIFEAINYIKHGYNGYYINNPSDEKNIISTLNKNQDLFKEICTNASKSIESNNLFINSWNEVFYNYF